MSLLQDLTSKDPKKIWSACGAIKDLREAHQLNELAQSIEIIKSATTGINLGGALCPNSYHLEFALKKLEHTRQNLGCLCALYPDNMFFDPAKEAKKGHVAVLDTVTIENKWVDYYVCECNICRSKFKVEEREGHFVWWSWKRA